MAPVDESPIAEAEKPQIVKDLEEVDDRYLAIERTYEKELNALIAKYTEMQKPLLEERLKLLLGESAEGPTTGTPALTGFWLTALQNHPAFEGEIEEYDEPVLKYIKDIKVSALDSEDQKKGFKLEFHFAENPFFKNAVLTKEYHTVEASPYTGDTDVAEIVGCTIEWKAGKNVTVEMVKKSTKGASAKKAKAGKAQEEPRNSFFRSFFRSLKKDGDLPDDIDPQEIAMAYGGDADDMDEEDMVGMILENDHEVGTAVKDNIIPFAVRWYTGEAAPEGDGDDEDGEEEDDEEDEEEDDEDDEDDEVEPPAKGKSSPKKGKQSSAKGASVEGKDKKEECKQQ